MVRMRHDRCESYSKINQHKTFQSNYFGNGSPIYICDNGIRHISCLEYNVSTEAQGEH